MKRLLLALLTVPRGVTGASSMLRRMAALAVVMAALCNVTPALIYEVHTTVSTEDPNAPTATVSFRSTGTPTGFAYGHTGDCQGVLGWTPTLASPQPVSCASTFLCAGSYYEYTFNLVYLGGGSAGQGPAYQFGIDDDAGAAGASACSTGAFLGPHKPGIAADYWFGAVGDIGSRNAYPNSATVQAALVADSASITGTDVPRLILGLGDLTYGETKGPDDVTQHFLDAEVWARTGAAYFPAWGEEEWGGGVGAALAEYRGRFKFPNSKTARGSPSGVNGAGGWEGPAGEEDWYWFDYGKVRFISYPEVYDPNTVAVWAADANSIFAAAQADANIKFIVAFGHATVWSTGAHAADGTSALGTAMAAFRTAHNKFVLSINGHSHNYERTVPASTNNITFVTIGTGGATLTPVGAPAAWTAVTSDHLGFLRCQATNTYLRCYFICGPPGSSAADTCVQGSVVDQFTVPAPGATPNAPPVGAIDDPNSVTITAGGSVTFASTTNDAEDGSPCVGCTYVWNFGTDSGITDSTSADPGAKTFENPGVYTVSFIATDTGPLADPTPSFKTVTVNAPTLTPPTTYYLRCTDGNDSPCNGRTNAAGSGVLTACAFKSVAKAESVLVPGDILKFVNGPCRVSGGFIVTKSGDAINGPITWEAASSTVALQSGKTIAAGSGGWEDAPDPAPVGEWRTVDPNIASPSAADTAAYIQGVADYEAGDVGLVMYKNNSSSSSGNAAGLRHLRVADPNAPTYTSNTSTCAIYVGPGVRQFTTGSGGDTRLHLRLKKTQELVDYEADYSQVLATDNPDPNTLTIRFSQAPYTLRVQGSFRKFKGLTFLEGGKDTILLGNGSTAKPSNVIFDGNTIWAGNWTAISTNGSSAYDVQVINNTITGVNTHWVGWMDYHGDGTLGKDCTPGELQRSALIDLRGDSARWTIAYNVLRNGFDGVSTSATETDIFVHHNRMENFGDDPFELEGTSVGHMEIYENYIANSLNCWAPGQDSTIKGPLFIYRNVCFLAREPFINRSLSVCDDFNGKPCQKYGRESGMKFDSSTPTGSNANTYIYHNTIYVSSSNVPNTSTPHGIYFLPGTTSSTASARERVFNNLFMVGSGGMQKSWPSSATDFVWDYNAYFRHNTADTSTKLFGGSYGTLADLQAGTPYEDHGVYGDPQIVSFVTSLAYDASVAKKWFVQPESQFKGPADFRIYGSSPAAGVAFPRCTDPGCTNSAPWVFTDAEGVVGVLPDSRDSTVDMGAIPVTANPIEWRIFPFTAGWTHTCTSSCPSDREGGQGISRYYQEN